MNKYFYKIKIIVKKCSPSFLIKYYRDLNRIWVHKQNRRKSVEEVFTAIYKNNRWGGKNGEYYSGTGSTREHIVSPYITMISEIGEKEGFKEFTFVDLGCGDFRVGRRLTPHCARYLGIDIVEPLIKRNQTIYGNKTTQFVHLNIVKDDLPHGDVCFVRQVLQHLSNEQIILVLKKLRIYNWVFITEHYPSDITQITPNVNKIQGHDIRLLENSGVYLCLPPFNLPSNSIEEVLEIQSNSASKTPEEQGVIKTFLYRPPQ